MEQNFGSQVTSSVPTGCVMENSDSAPSETACIFEWTSELYVLYKNYFSRIINSENLFYYFRNTQYIFNLWKWFLNLFPGALKNVLAKPIKEKIYYYLVAIIRVYFFSTLFYLTQLDSCMLKLDFIMEFFTNFLIG